MPHPFSNPQNRVVNGALWARCVEAKKVRNIYFHIWTKQNKKKMHKIFEIVSLHCSIHCQMKLKRHFYWLKSRNKVYPNK